MSYNVYLVEYIGAPRNHHAIFVETGEDGPKSGHLFHVKGDIQNGMTYEDKPAKDPETSGSYSDKTLLGVVTEENYSQISEICEGIPPPKKQFQGGKRLNSEEPLRRCQEWTGEVIDALTTAGILS